MFEFYRKYDSDKTKEEVIGIVNRRRNQGSPIGTRIPSKPWLDLCDKLGKKYGFHPLDTVFVDLPISSIEKIETVDEDIFNGIIPQRKAFIDWVNQTFYKGQIEGYKQYLKNLPEPDSEEEIKKIRRLKIYQYFVKEYLSIETPFRGLLIYHGLGTGKKV